MIGRYVEAALADELDRVRRAPVGGRHAALFVASASLGGIVAAGGLPEDLVIDELCHVAHECGLGRREVQRTVRDGLRRGGRELRVLPHRAAGRLPNQPAAPRHRIAVTPPSRRRPPRGEVAVLWESCRPVCDDDEVAAWLGSRGIDPGEVEDRDLARALPRAERLPRWATCWGRPWTVGWRLVFRAWGATGAAESLRARWVRDTRPSRWPKSAAAAAGEGSASGLVLADGLGQLVLKGGAPPNWWPDAPLEVVILEGEPDWLSWASTVPDGDQYAPAVVGVWQGAWDAAFARRLPAGTRIGLRTHLDAAGCGYASRAASTLLAHCRVWDLGGRYGA